MLESARVDSLNLSSTIKQRKFSAELDSNAKTNIFDKMSGWDGMGGTTGSRDQRKFYVCIISKICLSAGGWNKSRSAAPRGKDPAQRYDVWAV